MLLMFVTKVESEDGLFVTNDATRSLEKRCLDGNLPFLADRAMGQYDHRICIHRIHSEYTAV